MLLVPLSRNPRYQVKTPIWNMMNLTRTAGRNRIVLEGAVFGHCRVGNPESHVTLSSSLL